MPESAFPAGAFGDLTLGPDDVYLATESASRETIIVSRGLEGRHLIAELPGSPYRAGYFSTVIAGDLMATVGSKRWMKARGLKHTIGLTSNGTFALYPRLAISPGALMAVTYQAGPVFVLRFLSGRTIAAPAGHVPFGPESTCVAWLTDRFRWGYIASIEGVGIRLMIRDFWPDMTQAHAEDHPTETTQGISRIDATGLVITVDSDFLWPEYPAISRPWRSAELVVGQNNDGPPRNLGYVDGDPYAYRIFDGIAYRPRAVHPNHPEAEWQLLAMGEAGARTTTVPPFVLDAIPPEPPEPEPEPPEPEPEPPKPEPEPPPMPANYYPPNQDLDFQQLEWLTHVNATYFGEQLGCISNGSLSAWHHAYSGWIRYWHDAINKYAAGVPPGDPAMLQKLAQWACRQTGLAMQASFPGKIPDSEIPSDPFQ